MKTNNYEKSQSITETRGGKGWHESESKQNKNAVPFQTAKGKAEIMSF